MRLFIAIYPEKALVNEILQSYSQISDTYFHKMKAEEFHITLRFLGEVNEMLLPVLQKDLAWLQKVEQFHVQTDRVLFGIGGNKLYLEVIPSPQLLKLRDDLDEVLQKIGIPIRKESFIPHISMTRAKKFIPDEEKDQIKNGIRGMHITSNFLVRSIHLVKSELTLDGPIYTTLLTIPLNPI